LFEAAEVGHKVSKADYQAQLPELRAGLLEAQQQLRDAGFPLIVLLTGDDRAGCNAMLNTLHAWMDTRLIRTNALDAPTDEERERPEFWRYWRVLPPRGQIGIFLGGWTIRAIRDRLGKRMSKVDFERAIERIVRFERALVEDGALLLKLWLHTPKEALGRQLKLAKEQPGEAWWVQDVDHRLFKNYERTMKTVERALRKTSTGETPWTIVESTNGRFRDLLVGRTLLETLRDRLGSTAPRPGVVPQPTVELPEQGPHTILETIDGSSVLEKSEYDRRKKRAQAAIHKWTEQAREGGLSSVLVFEGSDAAGKGSCIRRLTRAMDAPNYRVFEIAAPSEEERAQHYLWRFWSRLPRAGRVIVFDRSWYGRVLVERVEGFAAEHEWRRAYSEINEFEEQLWEHGVLLLKFWLHVDPDVQLQRFREREKVPFKQYKITEEDYRNRDRRADYDLAANEMIARTSNEFAPWHLVPSNDKRWARVQVLETFAKALRKRLK
jgi:polyphosphate:AMP phosphotransferase